MTTYGVDRSGAAGGSGGSAVVSATSIQLFEPSGTDYVLLTAPSLSASWTFTFPADDGDANQVLITDGSGTTDWVGIDAVASGYALLAGRSSGQTLAGGTGASETLTLKGTAHATAGAINLNSAGGNVIIGGGTTASRLRLLEASGSGSNYTEFVVAPQAGNITYTLPTADAAKALVSDGAGALSWSNVDHGAQLTGLADDDHTQYALLAGRSGGQTLIGGTGASETLTLKGTSHGTVGIIALNSAGGHVTIGGGTAASELRFLEASGSGTNYTAFKAQAQSGDITYTLPAADGSAGHALKTNGSGTLSWGAAGGGSSGDITQSSHGFAVNDVLYHNGTIYAKADADAAATAEAIGIVTAVADANTFTLQSGGPVSGLTASFTAGTVYFVSGTAGELTATEPSTVGQISKPIFIATSTSGGWVVNMRGVTVGQASSSLAVSQANGDGSTTAFTLPAAPTHENNVFVTISGVAQHKDTFSVSGSTLTFSTAPPTGTSNIEFCVVGAVSIGTPSDGTVTWAKLATGAQPQWVLLASGSMSNVATVDFETTAAFDGTYDKLKIVGYAVPATDDVNLLLRVKDSTYQADANDYFEAGHVQRSDSATIVGFALETSTDIKIYYGLTAVGAGHGVGNATGEGIQFEILLSRPSVASTYKFVQYQSTVASASNHANSQIGGGHYRGSQNAITGIRLLFSSGNIASGSAQLYGLRTS